MFISNETNFDQNLRRNTTVGIGLSFKKIPSGNYAEKTGEKDNKKSKRWIFKSRKTGKNDHKNPNVRFFSDITTNKNTSRRIRKVARILSPEKQSKKISKKCGKNVVYFNFFSLYQKILENYVKNTTNIERKQTKLG